MLTSYCEYQTQAEAIREATKAAKENARDNGENCQERVLLTSGDTLILTSTPGGKVTRKLSAGWDTEGVLHGSRRVLAIACH